MTEKKSRGCLGIPVSLVEALHHRKIDLPIGKGFRTSCLGILLATIGLFCGGFTVYALVDAELREAGVLPTYTLTPSPTSLPPTATVTPRATDTAKPTSTATAEPTDTPTVISTVQGQKASVVEVVDGDTIKVAMNGQTYTVRYIGIDTPETKHPEKPIEWMGPQASEANRHLVGGKTVVLEKDVSETDQYGRLLRYVWLADGTLVNAELVRMGYAQASSYPPDVKYQDRFRTLQEEAREAGRGLWGPTPTPQVIPTNTPNPQPTATTGPTATPQPQAAPSTNTPIPQPVGPQVSVTRVDKRAEFVDITNAGDQPQDLNGWTLVSERGNQACSLGGVLQPGQTVRVWAMAEDAGQGGYNCNFGTNIWNNSKSDPAVLYNAQGVEISRY